MRQIYLLDTNVISEFSKSKPNAAVMNHINEVKHLCAISATVWEEITYGYERLPEGKRKDYIKEFMESIHIAYEVLPYDEFSAQICGEIQASCKKQGKTLQKNDTQIAATAIANGMVLVTHNTADYTPIAEVSNLKYEDWWA